MQTQTIKEAAHDLIDEQPDDATWRDLIYRVVLRASIEQGLSEADAEILTPHNDASPAIESMEGRVSGPTGATAADRK